MNRLEASAAWFGYSMDRAVVEARIAALARPQVPHRLRVLLERDGAIVLETTALDPAPAVVRLGIASRRVRSDDVFCLHKTTNRAVYDAARVAGGDADDVVLVNERGEAVETTVANLLFRRDGRWWTPPLSCGGLAGIGREVMLAEGSVEERTVLAAELAACEQLAVVSSLRGVRPAILLEP